MAKARSTLFPNGVSNASPNTFAALTNLRINDATKYVEDFTDFLTYNNTDLVEWDITTVETGGGTATRVLVDGLGGRLLVTNDNFNDDSTFFQRPSEAFRWAAGKEMWFRQKFQVSDAEQSDVIAGFYVTDETPIVSFPTDGLFFVSLDGTTQVDFEIRKNGTPTLLAGVATLVDATDIELAFHYDGAGTFSIYVNDVLVVQSSVTTNAPDDVDIAMGFGVQNGEAVIKTLNIDYIGGWLER